MIYKQLQQVNTGVQLYPPDNYIGVYVQCDGKT